jgi:hypothetical protein
MPTRSHDHYTVVWGQGFRWRVAKDHFAALLSAGFTVRHRRHVARVHARFWAYVDERTNSLQIVTRRSRRVEVSIPSWWPRFAEKVEAGRQRVSSKRERKLLFYSQVPGAVEEVLAGSR